ncbi:MAG TPA: ATP-binding protein, partial [Bacteroidia bacterium]|nr:ATP-binding protein [Bacteroidia bacterium]
MLRSVAAKRRKFTDTPLQTLQKLNFVVNNKPTWAAILLFGNDPNRFLPHARVHCGRFKGAKIIDDNYIEGDLFEQIDKTMSVIQRNISVEYVITGKKAQRDEVWEYPLDAIREAVINAICHRDYFDGNEITIKINDDSIVIWNPGTLPYGMTMEMYRNPNHSSVPRNKNIARALYDVEAIEHYGSGVKRILDACKASGMPTPEFEEQPAGFNVVFKKAKVLNAYEYVREAPTVYGRQAPSNLMQQRLTARQTKVVNYVHKNGVITNSELQKLLKVSHRTASRELTQLVTKKMLVKIGKTGKGTSYQIVKK